MTKQDIHLRQLRDIILKRLQVLELQSAQFGIYAPPHILIEIEDIKEKISQIDSQLKEISSSSAFQLYTLYLPIKTYCIFQQKEGGKENRLSLTFYINRPGGINCSAGNRDGGLKPISPIP